MRCRRCRCEPRAWRMCGARAPGSSRRISARHGNRRFSREVGSGALLAVCTASIVTFGARRPHWREVVLSSSCASERVRRSSQCGGSRDCQSPLQLRRALPCLVSCRNKAFASGCCCLHWAQHMLKSSSWALCGLLDVVHTSFGRLMGREHVNCAAGPHQVLVYVKVIRRSLQVSGFSALRNSAIPFSNDA